MLIPPRKSSQTINNYTPMSIALGKLQIIMKVQQKFCGAKNLRMAT